MSRGYSRNADRDREILRLSTSGMTEHEIARRMGLSQGRISQILVRMRGARLPIDTAQLKQDMLDQLNRMRAAAEEIAQQDAAPVVKTVEGGIAYVKDPESDQYVRDHSGRLAAMREIKAIQERTARLIGADAPSRVETGVVVRYSIEGIDMETLR